MRKIPIYFAMAFLLGSFPCSAQVEPPERFVRIKIYDSGIPPLLHPREWHLEIYLLEKGDPRRVMRSMIYTTGQSTSDIRLDELAGDVGLMVSIRDNFLFGSSLLQPNELITKLPEILITPQPTEAGQYIIERSRQLRPLDSIRFRIVGLPSEPVRNRISCEVSNESSLKDFLTETSLVGSSASFEVPRRLDLTGAEILVTTNVEGDTARVTANTRDNRSGIIDVYFSRIAEIPVREVQVLSLIHI